MEDDRPAVIHAQWPEKPLARGSGLDRSDNSPEHHSQFLLNTWTRASEQEVSSNQMGIPKEE
jgi:hypothetical protein